MSSYQRALLLGALPLLLGLRAATAAVTVRRGTGTLQVSTPRLQLHYRLRDGLYDVAWPGGAALRGVSCDAQLSDGTALAAPDYPQHVCTAADVIPVSDGFGKGVAITVHHRAPGKPELRQRLWVYDGRPEFYCQVEVVSPTPVASRDIAPLAVDAGHTPGAGLRLDAGSKPRTLFVPYDNDAFVRYNSDFSSDSYEVTAVYDNPSRHGFVLGSVTHDLWKTRLTMADAGTRTLGRLRAYGGATGQWTHDTQPHGLVSGRVIASPRLFVGFFTDWRDGLEAYGRANARLTPPLPWAAGPPFGWNSWYPYTSHVDYARYVQTADILKTDLQPKGFQNGGVVYVNLDSFWDNLSEAQLQEAVRHIHASGQKAGIYWTPFTYWGDDFERTIAGTGGRYKARDILLKDAAGEPLPKLDGGHPIDPTHPGALDRIDEYAARFVRWGFDYVKLDFINAGALEGAHFDPRVTTGTAAYNLGMRRLAADLAPQKVGRPFFLSLSIAPLFPAGFAHARRISCDAQGSLGNSEYVMNALTYGWWANGSLYAFDDPDMVPLSANAAEARTRVNTAVIAGTVFLDGDDLTDPAKRARAEVFLTNPEVNAVARAGRTFRPVEGDTGSHAADVFVRSDPGGALCVAVFNWDGKQPAHKDLDLARLGLRAGGAYRVRDLWTHQETHARGRLSLDLAPAESVLLRLTPE